MTYADLKLKYDVFCADDLMRKMYDNAFRNNQRINYPMFELIAVQTETWREMYSFYQSCTKMVMPMPRIYLYGQRKNLLDSILKWCWASDKNELYQHEMGFAAPLDNGGNQLVLWNFTSLNVACEANRIPYNRWI